MKKRSTDFASLPVRKTFQMRARRVVFALLPALFVLLLLELASLLYYFQERGPEVFGLQAAVRDLRAALAAAGARDTVGELELPPAEKIYDALYSSAGTALLDEFERRYAATFERLVADVRAVDAKLLVLYLPPPFDHETARRVDHHDRAFYRGLATAHDADFLDVTDALAPYPAAWTHLLPHNPHPSRLGNQVLAEALAERLEQPPYRGYRSSHRGGEQPALLGDLPPSTRRVWHHELMPFRVTTSSQGLRMDRDLEFPADRQRILFLGDSFTFGINLHDAHTYPALLQARLPDREVVNAGVPGYTILQEQELFAERARFAEPDVVVLQVLFNDLYGLFYFERNLFSREVRNEVFVFGRRRPGGASFEPSELEKELLTGLGMKFP